MPRYKVKVPGFYNSKFYDPNGKRPYLDVDKPFTKANPMPSWVEDMPKESATLKAKREAYEKAQAELEKAKAEEDKKDVNAASSEGAGESKSFLGDMFGSKKPSTVETL